MSFRSRAYHGEADFQRVSDLLIESRRTVEHNECWGVERWEALRYAGYVRDELAGANMLGDAVRLWEDESDRLDDRADLERYCATEIATFGKTIWTPETVRVLARASTYRADSDLVAVAPDSGHAAFATVWYDAPSRAGVFEPVGTHPNERRRGLALALLNEGLRRVRALGGTVAYVGTGSDSPANRLYEAAGFALINVMHRWTKALEEVDSSACR